MKRWTELIEKHARDWARAGAASDTSIVFDPAAGILQETARDTSRQLIATMEELQARALREEAERLKLSQRLSLLLSLLIETRRDWLADSEATDGDQYGFYERANAPALRALGARIDAAIKG